MVVWGYALFTWVNSKGLSVFCRGDCLGCLHSCWLSRAFPIETFFALRSYCRWINLWFSFYICNRSLILFFKRLLWLFVYSCVKSYLMGVKVNRYWVLVFRLHSHFLVWSSHELLSRIWEWTRCSLLPLSWPFLFRH